MTLPPPRCAYKSFGVYSFQWTSAHVNGICFHDPDSSWRADGQRMKGWEIMTFTLLAAITLLTGTFLFSRRLSPVRVALSERGRRRRMRRRARPWYMD